MTRDETIDRLKHYQADFEQLGVLHLYLFGSAANNTARTMSDVDLFFDHRRGEIGLFEVMDVADRVSMILGRTADVTTRSSLHPRLKSQIEAQAIRVF